jgi:outer membrane protein assembly factor BamB/rRNA maturation protein Nop10
LHETGCMTNPRSTELQAACPSCGAKKRSATEAKCSYCGTLLRVAQPDPASPNTPYAKTFGRRHLWTFVLVGILLMIGALSQAFRTSDVPKPGPPSTTGKRSGQAESLKLSIPIVTLARAEGGSDVLLTNHDKELVLVDGATGKLRWKSEAFGQLRQEHVLVGEGAAYVVDQTRMVAISLKDGKTAWQTSVVAELTYGGKAAMMLAKSTILALQKDGSLQAFDRNTGAPAWNENLEYRPNQLYRVGNEVLILHSESGQKKDQYAVDLVDATTGTVNRTLRISYRYSGFDRVVTPGAHSKFVFSDDGKEMYVVYGGSNLCVERWNLSNGTKAWQYCEKGPYMGGPETVLLADQALLIFKEAQAQSIARASGSARSLTTDKDHTFKPVAVRDGVVVLQAKPVWDRDLLHLWGVDLETGSKLWSVALPKQNNLENIKSGIGGFLVRMTKDGLAVVQILKDDRIVLDRLDLKTGVSPGRKTLQIGSGWKRLIEVDDSAYVWLDANGKLHAIDLASWKLTYQLE